ncbi:MAG: histidine kinase [Hydrococcus sp. SU_1_0]|nr:histidine kinase [Hydrococcus sp. SU_1_0]
MKPIERVREFWLHLPVRRRGLVIVAIPITCLITSLTVFSLLQLKLIERERQTEQAHKIYSETQRLITTIVNAEIGVQDHLITGKVDYLDSYQAALTIFPDSFKKLQPLIEHNPNQQERFQLAKQLLDESLTTLDKLRQQRKQSENSSIAVFSSVKLTAEIEKSRDIIDEAKWYLYLISTMEERRLLSYQHNLEVQKQFYWLFIAISAILGTLGSVVAIYLIYRLDEELKEQASHLQQTNQLLSQVNEQLQLFTANASHELRAPLAAVMSNAQAGLLAPPHDLEQPRQKLAKIVTITKSMSELISSLLFLARQEKLLDSTLMEAVDIVPLLNQLTTEFSLKAVEKNLSLQTYIPNKAIALQVEPELLRQAVANLLSNAIKYSTSGDKIVLRLHSQAELILIQVEDSGMGIPETMLPLYFQTFLIE